ncbi:hypothetical protein [Streptomyces sp. NBC_00233]|uniref:hypothetical protein n=1 Tax=Streptomyces sp. NBC_00233 TaxID=2975686 RepID=UPI0022527631|nr:hypothetical protein [Streptomyces sp. NBC_00233]MCX5231445.1 hypothetical protein [Streptomyces sp. NBC_00233]MCX5233009.1 hypothetical protein [Streptomyces sp. NBC_00233]
MIQPVTGPDPVENELRHAMMVSARGYDPSPAPVQKILRSGQARRARRRTVMTAACAVLVACLGTSVASLAGSLNRDTSTGQQAAPASAFGVVSQVVGSGVVDGKSWSVTAKFYPTFPAGFKVPAKLADKGPAGKSLLCQQTVIGGVRVDHQGGEWSGCQVVNGTSDITGQGAGLHGLGDKGLTGVRIFVGNPDAKVTRAVITLKDGRHFKAGVRTLPGTNYRSFAIPLGKGQTIASVDQYDAGNHRLTHDTFWR